jgi:hypothetical protein
MALTNAEKQAAHRARQAQALADMAAVIERQSAEIVGLQARVADLAAQLQKETAAKHAMELKMLRAQLKAK